MAIITTRQELKESLMNVLAIEIGARDLYIEDIKHFKHKHIKNTIKKIKEDEDKHIKIIKKLIKMLEKNN